MTKKNKISKAEFKAQVDALRVDLLNMQYDLRKADFSVLVILTGNDRQSVNELLNRLHEWMDARYLRTRVFLPPKNEELEFPNYWRYWRALPSKGQIGLFLGAWPLRALAERLLDGGTEAQFNRRITHMKTLENGLAHNGTVVLKFWLHIPKQKLGEIKQSQSVNEYIDLRMHDWHIYEHYDQIQPLVDTLVKNTNTPLAPWHTIEASDTRHRDLTVAKMILQRINRHLKRPERQFSSRKSAIKIPLQEAALNGINLSSSLERTEYRERLSNLQASLGRLMVEAREKFSIVLVFEGWDAAGKGGVIRRITRALFAADYRVYPIAAPTDEELSHHYLWRFWRRLPRDGRMAIFDRSWYGRVLVERIEGFASTDEWQRAYDEINDFEKQIIEHGTLMRKFWLHIDKDEQLRRFQAREKTAYKKYKITDEDYRNREKWDTYTDAVNDMIALTNTQDAPWQLVPANDKKWARVQVLETLVTAINDKLAETST